MLRRIVFVAVASSTCGALSACGYSWELPVSSESDASVAGGEAGSDAGNDAPVPDLADLRIDLAASPLSPGMDAGVMLRYRIRNFGPGPAINVVATLQMSTARLDEPVTTPDGWSCEQPAVGESGQLVCRHPRLPFGGPSNVIGANATWTSAGSASSVRGSVTADTPDPQPNNNEASAQSSLP